MTAAERMPRPANPAAGRAASAPHGCAPSCTPLAIVNRVPAVMMPPVNDHDADDISGWAGVVKGIRGAGPLSRPSGMTPGPSEAW